MFTVNKNPTLDELRKFGYAMLVGFLFLGAVIYLAPLVKTREVFPWLGFRDVSVLKWAGTWRQWTAVCLGPLGVVLCGLCLLSPSAAKPVYIVWMTVAVAVGTVVSTVMLTLLFVFLLPMFSLVVRIGDPLRKKLRREGSYWEDYKPHEPTIERMKRPF